MEVTIGGEEEGNVGVQVVDNNGNVHQIALQSDGEIFFHDAEGYAELAADRSTEENEAVNQARRLAAYAVYRELGWDTLAPRENPERLAATAAAVNAISLDRFEQLFGDCYRQLRSHHDEEVEPVVEVPEEAGDRPVFYQKDVYLGFDPKKVLDLDVDLRDRTLVDLFLIMRGDDEVERRIFDDLDLRRDRIPVDDAEEGEELPVRSIEAVSPIHTRWTDDGGESHVIRSEVPALDREPDARIEIASYEPASLEEFQQDLVHHLVCQVRDRFIGMGIAPPQGARVPGPGRFRTTTRYQHLDCYEPYHRYDVEITDWQEDSTPEGYP